MTARSAWIGALAGVGAALPLALWMWGFTVDDALVSVRYARHLASGAGYRFDVVGPSTDGVTPLPWAFVLAPFAHGDALTTLLRAKCLGLGAWLGAAAAWGAAVARAPGAAWAKSLAFAGLALSVPVAAHAVCGMETALAMALATLASVAARPVAAATLAGLVASLRPEMGAWALVLAATRGFERDAAPARRALLVALALGPFAACALARIVVFGRAAPLAVLAKPSTADLGLSYAGAAAIVALAPIAVAAPFALRRAPMPARALALAGLAHFGAVVVVGGDWMPYARLVAPIAPSLFFAFVLAAPAARAWSTFARGGAAVAVGVALVATGGTSGRSVGADRAVLVALARPLLADARVVAALDIGWLSAATEGTIVDLAGITDPTIAALPGGHTSKRVDAPMLLDRGADALLLYASSPVDVRGDAWTTARYPRVVEARLARAELIRERFAARTWLPLGTSGAGYVLLVRAR